MGDSIQRAPMLRATHGDPSMDLPAGKTCSDRVHFGRCRSIYGHIAADEVCDFAPSRFHPARTEPSIADRLDALMTRMREERCEATYADLLAVRGAS